MPKSRTKVCRVCEVEYVPRNTTQVACSPFCAAKYVKAQKAEKQKTQWRKEAREFRKQDREKKLTRKAGPLRQAQDAVNEFIRVRDEDKPCIVHGHNCPYADTGRDAGHFRSTGAMPALRFNTWNIHGQCRAGNRGAHKYTRYETGVDEMYETGIRRRIGDARVDWLKGPHSPRQYKAQDLSRIAKIFRARARLYRKLRSK